MGLPLSQQWGRGRQGLALHSWQFSADIQLRPERVADHSWLMSPTAALGGGGRGRGGKGEGAGALAALAYTQSGAHCAGPGGGASPLQWEPEAGRELVLLGKLGKCFLSPEA